MELAHVSTLKVPFGFTEEVTRRAYLHWGAVLFLLRYAVEAALVARLAGRVLDPLTFLTPFFARPEAVMGPAGLALTLSALPFVWVAVSMSVRRAAAAGRREYLGFLVLVPGLHYVVVAVLAALPDRPEPSTAKPTGPFREAWGAVHEALEPAVNAPQLRAAMVFALLCVVSVFVVWPADHDPLRWQLLCCPAAAAGIATWFYRRPAAKPVEPVDRATAPTPMKKRREVNLPARGAWVGCLLGCILVVWVALSAEFWRYMSGPFLLVVALTVICSTFAAIGATACAGEGRRLSWLLVLSILAGLAGMGLGSALVAIGSALVFLGSLLGVLIRALVVPWGAS
ncbi:MAG: hypothetical protein JNL21_39005 [Myxococcales bacterium]|nr:hypothetical protein [Myxococcales bacterium]